MVRHSGQDFINVKGIPVTQVLTFRATDEEGSEFCTPEADGFATYGDMPFSEEILNISMTEVEALVQPDCIGNDIWWGHPIGIAGADKYTLADSINF